MRRTAGNDLNLDICLILSILELEAICNDFVSFGPQVEAAGKQNSVSFNSGMKMKSNGTHVSAENAS
jgi:hypothetical protein